jgi:hypothetical protein
MRYQRWAKGLYNRDMATENDALLRAIDSKLTALLALILDSYLRDTGVARPKERSIDRLLTDAGLPADTVAALLGKTRRAVYLQLQREDEATGRKKAKGDG